MALRKRQKKKTTKKAKKARKSIRIGRRRNSAPEVVIRRNAAPRARKSDKSDERIPLKERVQDMDGSHVAAGIGAGALGNILGVLVVGQGWLGPKLTAGLLLGGGAAATAAGYYWEADHLMAAGAGLAAAGTFSLTNQYAVNAYETLEARAREKQAKREKEANQKRLAETKAVIQAATKKAARNASPHLVIVPSEPDDDFDDVGDDDDSDTDIEIVDADYELATA